MCLLVTESQVAIIIASVIITSLLLQCVETFVQVGWIPLTPRQPHLTHSLYYRALQHYDGKEVFNGRALTLILSLSVSI
jgi:CHASE2 domain-containing sensor protein